MGIVARARYWRDAVLLGIATIGAYGVVYYAFGVFIEPLHDETGWSTGTLSLAYSAGVLLSGVGAVVGGRALDRRGPRPVMVTAVVVGALGLFAASEARQVVWFVASWAIAGGAVAGGLYYNVTMSTTSRLYADRRATAVSVLTLLGALASPIFNPLVAWMVEAWGWREALRALAVLLVILAGPAALIVRSEAVPAPPRTPGDRGAWREPMVWRLILAACFSAGATSALLLHQVSAIRALGLSLATAAALGGARGLMQIPGRLVLTPLTNWLGVHTTQVVCYGMVAAGASGLVFADGLVAAWFFVIAAGLAIGLSSPLNGLLGAEAYGARLGTFSGMQAAATSVASAGGAWLAGVAVDRTGDYGLTLAGIATLEVGAAAALLWQRHAVRAARAGNAVAVSAEGERA